MPARSTCRHQPLLAIVKGMAGLHRINGHCIKGQHEVHHLAVRAGCNEGMCSCMARQARHTQVRSLDWQAAVHKPTSSAACPNRRAVLHAQAACEVL